MFWMLPINDISIFIFFSQMQELKWITCIALLKFSSLLHFFENSPHGGTVFLIYPLKTLCAVLRKC